MVQCISFILTYCLSHLRNVHALAVERSSVKVCQVSLFQYLAAENAKLYLFSASIAMWNITLFTCGSIQGHERFSDV